jgi:hypothetical protein
MNKGKDEQIQRKKIHNWPIFHGSFFRLMFLDRLLIILPPLIAILIHSGMT